jgi:hypothetical protein
VKDDQYTVVLVYSTSHALRAEKVLAEMGIDCKLIPVPRQLSSDCGVCVRVRTADRRATERTLKEVGLEIEGVYEI